MQASELLDLIRSHSRLHGVMATNVETWLREPATIPRYLSLIQPPGPGESRLLEIGCYQPAVGYYFALGWREVFGIFKDDGEGTTTEGYSDDHGSRVSFARVDVEVDRMPIPDDWADAVVMMQVWEHFGVDPMHTLWEVNRVLKPGGRFILSTPNGASWSYAKRIALGRAAWGGMEFTGFSTNRHNRLYDSAELAAILEQAGFAVTTCVSQTFGHVELGLSDRVFRWGLALLDAVTGLLSSRRRERGQTLVATVVKQGPPRQRFPSSLYLSETDWPGIAEERDRVQARHNHGSR